MAARGIKVLSDDVRYVVYDEVNYAEEIEL